MNRSLEEGRCSADRGKGLKPTFPSLSFGPKGPLKKLRNFRSTKGKAKSMKRLPVRSVETRLGFSGVNLGGPAESDRVTEEKDQRSRK